MSNKDSDRCLVCGDVPLGINFGALTCMPCKAFFRRNAPKLDVEEFVCQGDGNCSITYKYRRLCNCCRLAKCFRVGMKRSLILSDEEREARNKLVEINRLKHGKVPKRSCVRWMQPPSLLRITQNTVQYLSPSDQIILANIFHAYENTCIAAKNSQLQCYPAIQHTSLHAFFNGISAIFPVVIDYFKHIPEFAKIPMDDKLRLVKNHLGDIANINEPLLYGVTPSNLIVTWTNLFGLDITRRLLKRNQIIEQYLFDPILLKLVLIILVLSSSSGRHLDSTDIDEICDDTLVIYAAQNVYVELLWRYILSRALSEGDAVKFLNKLMMLILYMQSIHRCMDEYINNLSDEVKQMEPIMQSMFLKKDDEEKIIDINIDEGIIQ